MMAGTAGEFPAGQFTKVVSAASSEQTVSTTNADGGLAGPTIDAGVYNVKAGETFKIQLKVSNNSDGFNAINSWLDVDTNKFEIVKMESGDPSMQDYKDSEAYSYATVNTFDKKNAASGVKTILTLYSDTNNLKGDMVLATITLKVKDNVTDGYYSLPFDANGDGGAMANRLITEGGERTPQILNPTFKGAVGLRI